MSLVKRKVFRKKDYRRILYWVIDFCLEKFGYRIRPYVLESKLEKGEMMIFCESHRHYAILYDWQQFRKLFGKYNFELQEAYAMSIAAHEMRHYYQIRQVDTKKPRENEETIAKWRDNHLNGKVFGKDGCTLLEFFMQPMELDAALYSYYFVAKILERAVSFDYVDKDYINVLKREYINMFGEDDEDLYIFDAEEL